MVAGEHQHVACAVAPQHVDVLVDRVRRALVPVTVGGLLRGQELDELVEAPVEEGPAALQMVDQPVGLVLRGDTDAPQARVEAVRQGEVDDAEFSTEWNGGFRAPLGERPEARAPASR